MEAQNIADTLRVALQNSFGSFLQNIGDVVLMIVVAIVVFVIGWLVAAGVGRFVAEVLRRLRFNQVFERGGWKQALERADLRVDPAGFIGAIFKWVLVIVSLLVAVDILGLTAFSEWLREDVLGYLPNVLVAALIFVSAVIIADLAEKIVRAGVEGAGIGRSQLIGAVVRWSIWVFAILSALLQLQIAVVPIEALIRSLFENFGFGLAAAFAIAFGLGGKDAATEVIQDLRKKLG